MTEEGKQEQKGNKNRKKKIWSCISLKRRSQTGSNRDGDCGSSLILTPSFPGSHGEHARPFPLDAHLRTRSSRFALDGAARLLPARLLSRSALLPSAGPRAPLVPLFRPAESPSVCAAAKHPLTRTGSLRLCCHSNLGARSPSTSSSAGSVEKETACPRVCTSGRDVLAKSIPLGSLLHSNKVVLFSLFFHS